MITWDERTGIIKEIKDWSEQVLEPSNPEFNDLPACPYAKAAWQEHKVKIVFKFEKEDYKQLYMALHNWSDLKDLTIIVDTEFIRDNDEFHQFVDNVNKAIADNVFRDRDMWVMGFHPDDSPNEYVDDSAFCNLTEEVYAIIFVQRLSKLHESADKLKKRGYYKIYNYEYDAEEIFKLRETLYRRLKHGNET